MARNITTSLQDAQSLFSKWLKERSPLAVFCSANGLRVDVDRGFIRSLGEEEINFGSHQTDIKIPIGTLEEGFTYKYSEPKRTPEGIMGDLSKEYAGALNIRTSTLDCTIYELAN
jgi:hypothetical protein